MRHRLVLILMTIAAVTASVAAYYHSAATESSPAFVTAAVARGDFSNDWVDATLQSAGVSVNGAQRVAG